MPWITYLEGGPRRVNHAAVAVGHKIYSFGGYCTGSNSREYTSMDVHVLNTTTFRWFKHPVTDLPYFENDDILPFKRYGHTAVVYEEKVYIWGGRNDRASCNTLFCFDTVWHCWTAPECTGTIPPARDGHTACVWKNYMIIYGGYEEWDDCFADSVYYLDLNTMNWNLVRIEGLEPSLRDFHTSVIIGDRMYMFGGRGTSYQTARTRAVYSNTLWYLDLLDWTWHTVDAVGGIPIGRRSHSAFVYEDKMYIFGGYNSIKEQHYNHMFEFNTKTNEWKRAYVPGRSPTKRRRQACVLVGDRVFIFGGTSPSNTTNDPNDQLIDHSDMYVLDFKPTLKTLCILAVRKHKLKYSSLPTCLQENIKHMMQHNRMSTTPKRELEAIRPHKKGKR